MTPLERLVVSGRRPWLVQVVVCLVLVAAMIALLPLAAVASVWHGLRGGR